MLYGLEGPAKSYITELGSIGTVEKNRVTKTFELGQDRLLTTTGIEKGETIERIEIHHAYRNQWLQRSYCRDPIAP